MSLARLSTRLRCLETQAYQILWYEDELEQLMQYVAEAGTQAALDLDVLQTLCTALRRAGQELGQQCPRRYMADAKERGTVVDRMMRMLCTTLDTQLSDPPTRKRLYQAIGNVFEAAQHAGR